MSTGGTTPRLLQSVGLRMSRSSRKTLLLPSRAMLSARFNVVRDFPSPLARARHADRRPTIRSHALENARAQHAIARIGAGIPAEALLRDQDFPSDTTLGIESELREMGHRLTRRRRLFCGGGAPRVGPLVFFAPLPRSFERRFDSILSH